MKEAFESSAYEFRFCVGKEKVEKKKLAAFRYRVLYVN